MMKLINKIAIALVFIAVVLAWSVKRYKIAEEFSFRAMSYYTTAIRIVKTGYDEFEMEKSKAEQIVLLDKAESEIKAAISAFPLNYSYYALLGDIYKRQNKNNESLQQYKIAQKLGWKLMDERDYLASMASGSDNKQVKKDAKLKLAEKYLASSNDLFLVFQAELAFISAGNIAKAQECINKAETIAKTESDLEGLRLMKVELKDYKNNLQSNT